MKILVYVDEYLPISQTFITNQLHFLSKRNVIVVVCQKKITTTENPDIIELKLPHIIYRIKLGLQRRGYFKISKVLTNHRLKKVVNQINPDIIIAHFGPNVLDISNMAPKYGIIGIIHGYDGSKLLFQNQSYRKAILTLSNSPNIKLLFVSQYLFDIAKSYVPNLKGQVFHLGIPIHNKYLTRDININNKIQITQISRCVHKKGIINSIEALNALVASYPDLRQRIKFDLIGDGPLLIEYQNLIQKLNLLDIIELHGEKDQQFVHEILMKTCIYLQPSIIDQEGDSEGLSISLCEALSYDILTITTKYSGIEDLIDTNQEGIFLVDGSPKSIFSSLNAILHKGLYNQKFYLHEIINNKFNIKIQTKKLEKIALSFIH